MNKRTDTHLMSRTSSPEPRMPSPPPRPIPGTPGRRASVGLSQPFTWYRADWGTGGNKFPVHLSPRDTGGPWEGHGRPGVSAFKSPVDAFAGLDQQPEKEYQRFILNRSIAHGSWTPRQTPEEWSSTLLAKGTVVLSGDKSSKPFSTVEKLEFAWEPTKHVRKSFKPIPKEELSPCAHTPHLPATAPPPPPPIQRLSTRLCLSGVVLVFHAQDPRLAEAQNRQGRTRLAHDDRRRVEDGHLAAAAVSTPIFVATQC